MTPETVAAVALDILRERGWHQGGYVGSDGTVCLEAAIALAVTSGKYADSCMAGPSWPIISVVSDLVGHPSLAAWNDDPHTTFEDVQLVLKRVANGEGVE